jgi:hypothetical protein
MAIPGLRPTFETKAKVRIGEKKTSAKGNEYPSSVDYFICDDADFARVVGAKQNRITIYLPFQAADDNFSTGLEWWQGKLLACYSKGELENGTPVALRQATMEKGGKTVNLLEGATVLSDEPVGKDRRKIACPVRECPILKKGDCKPMGRLQFWVEGIPREAGVFQLDTKSWNSIENLEATLSLYPDLRNVPFTLRVEMTQRGRDKFPELYLEAAVEINSPADAALADALVQLRKGVEVSFPPDELKLAICNVLDQTNPGWRDSPEFIEAMKSRMAEVGPLAAAQAILARHEL